MKVIALLKLLAAPVCVLIQKVCIQRSKVQVAKIVIQNADQLSDEQTEAICKMMR